MTHRVVVSVAQHVRYSQLDEEKVRVRIACD
jgi:hypothetical protein